MTGFEGMLGSQLALGISIYVLMGQLATSAGCTRFHEIAPRLARGLLIKRLGMSSTRDPIDPHQTIH